jgi:hypothetical protein
MQTTQAVLYTLKGCKVSPKCNKLEYGGVKYVKEKENDYAGSENHSPH